MRKKRLVGSLLVVLAILIAGIVVLGQVLPTPSQSSGQEELPLERSPPAELPSEETPPNLLVIPEVPIGTLGVVLTGFLALLISQIKPRSRMR